MSSLSNKPEFLHTHSVLRQIHLPDHVSSKFRRPLPKASHMISVRMLADSVPHVVGSNHSLGKPIVQRTTACGAIEKGVFRQVPDSDHWALTRGVRLQKDGLCIAGDFYTENDETALLDEGLILQLANIGPGTGWAHLSTGYHDSPTPLGIQMPQVGSKRTPQAILTGSFEWEDHRGHILMCGHVLYPDGSGTDMIAGDPIRSHDDQFLNAVTELYPSVATLRAQRQLPDRPLSQMKSVFTKDLEGMLTMLNKEFDRCILGQISEIRKASSKQSLLKAVIAATEAIEPHLQDMTPPDLRTCQQYARLFNHLGSYGYRGELFRS